MVNEFQSAILVQSAYYGVTIVLTLVAAGLFQRGFFWKYVKVRLSFGRLLMVKIKTVLSDHFAVGRIEDGFLLFKLRGDTLRLSIDDPQSIYRCTAINWVDVDEKTNSILLADYSAVSGYDARKFDNLFVRCLTRPTIGEAKDKIILIAVIIVGLLAAGGLFLSFQTYDQVSHISGVVLDGVKAALSNALGAVPAG